MLIPAVHPGTNTMRSVPVLLIPSLSDCLFLAILLRVENVFAGADVPAGVTIRQEHAPAAACRKYPKQDRQKEAVGERR